MLRTVGSVLRADPAEKMALEELIGEWRRGRGPLISRRYEEREIASRPIAKARLKRLAQDPGLLVRFQDELVSDRVSAGNRAEALRPCARSFAGAAVDIPPS